ncbi:MAG: hypothetical protein ABIK09_20155 [Pseudomonadota bacterium]
MKRLCSIPIFVVALALGGCSGGGDGDPSDAGPEILDTGPDAPVCPANRRVGQPCETGCDCDGGICALNEYAPFRFCTRPCDAAQPGTPCTPETGETVWTSLCVEFPLGEFVEAPRRFCAPLCEDLGDCGALGAPWETCEQPEWKGNPLYASLPDKVCISPSAQGHEPIDPDSCDGWQALYPTSGGEVAACEQYCQFLDSCKLVDALTFVADCCAFHCIQAVIPDGDVLEDLFKDIRCYADNFQAFYGTALVCTKPLESCSAEPILY